MGKYRGEEKSVLVPVPGKRVGRGRITLMGLGDLQGLENKVGRYHSRKRKRRDRRG